VSRALAVRLAAWTALAVFAAQAWGGIVRPAADGRLVAAAGLGTALGIATRLVASRPAPARWAAHAAVGVTGVLGALLLAGVPVSMLAPAHWDDLARGLRDGIAALPGLAVPYRGVEEWNRIALLLGGTLLAVVGPLVACRPGVGGRLAPAAVLVVLYAVPAVQLPAAHPFLEGALFAVLLAAALFGERLAAREAPAAAAALALAALVGLALAPRLDADDPWVDYEAIAESLVERGTTSFSWDHSYGPLDWPRDGREVLRVSSRTGSYWKATTLAHFDGVRWTEGRRRGLPDDPAAQTPDPRWVRTLRVTIRNLRTTQFVSAGTTLRIWRSPREVIAGAPGSFVTPGRPLVRGHAYLARVYDPRPTGAQLDAAGVAYPPELWPYLTMQLPPSAGGAPAAGGTPEDPVPPGFVVFRPFGSDAGPIGRRGRAGDVVQLGEAQLEASPYARMYRLAQRLARGATTPYQLVRRVQEHLSTGFTYTETPPAARLPLDAFLFRDKAGYCQQFSGAMALLLRMGGVPARVASGFSPGTYDTGRRQYVVRDLDAHSWVEVYFPGYGWVTFDPTPAVAPARAQSSGLDDEPIPAVEEEDDGEEAADAADAASSADERDDEPAGGGAEAAAGEGSVAPSRTVAGAALVVVACLALAGAALVLLRRRRHARMSVDDRVRELERALRRSGLGDPGGVTLHALEQRLRAEPQAAAYVRALRLARYGRGGARPTARQRAAVRRALAAGLGLRGRLRTLRALPPW
jgi:transglutaminase-like putative cysteine protease